MLHEGTTNRTLINGNYMIKSPICVSKNISNDISNIINFLEDKIMYESEIVHV